MVHFGPKVAKHGPKGSRWAQKGPGGPKRVQLGQKGSQMVKTLGLTILVPFGPLWNVNKPAMFGHFLIYQRKRKQVFGEKIFDHQRRSDFLMLLTIYDKFRNSNHDINQSDQ